jgi:hypothetical protein
MPSQTGIEPYTFQSVTQASSLFHQDIEMYNDQQIVATSCSERFADTNDPYKQQRPNRDFTAQVRDLQRHYTILDDDDTMTGLLAEEPALYSLLIDAIVPLQRAFGDRRLVYIRIQSCDEDSLLKVAIRLPANFGGDPECALQAFDEEWWLNNCHRSGGTLVFDYEMQDAI